ncbi:thioredoxin domain-containing protein [Thalassiella azotivora]
MTNRLADATSPYLLQHADNPVDWWPWCPEAFEEARRRDVPVLLSVGYAACHWCHVMAHESFEDDATAAVMNELYVNVKVDREERPDVDATYMQATTAMTGHGGWPMTVFLTPDARPFYAGTYFPPRSVQGMPAFTDVLRAVGQAWTERRDEVDGQAGRLTEALRQRADATASAGRRAPTTERLGRAVEVLAREEDAVHGGFGGAPKFPPSMVCEFLLRHAATRAPTADRARGLAERTLRAMAWSGTYDQVAGGFARYSVDAAWVVPHFEKMLYDNALLARVYLHWWRLTGDGTGRRVALETCDWMLADLLTPQGGLASSLDADTPVDGRAVEGATYVWTPDTLREALGPDDGAWTAGLLGVTPEGTFEHGTSTARLTRDVWADPAERERWVRARQVLRQARAARPQPARDDKVVAAWNGLAVAALAETGALCDRPDLVAAAERVADLLVAVHLDDHGHLRRVSRDGVVGDPPAVLEDLGDVAEGLLALHAVTGERAWADVAGGLVDTVLEEFTDGTGGFHDTSSRAADPALEPMGRGGDPSDNATPSGWTAAAGALLTWSALTGSARHREAAEAALGVVDALGGSAPRFAGWGLAVAQAAVDGPLQVAVVGPPGDDRTAALHRVALASPAPGAVVAAADGAAPDAQRLPLLRDRGPVDGGPAAHVCRGFVCELPSGDPAAVAVAVGALAVERAPGR